MFPIHVGYSTRVVKFLGVEETIMLGSCPVVEGKADVYVAFFAGLNFFKRAWLGNEFSENCFTEIYTVESLSLSSKS